MTARADLGGNQLVAAVITLSPTTTHSSFPQGSIRYLDAALADYETLQSARNATTIPGWSLESSDSVSIGFGWSRLTNDVSTITFDLLEARGGSKFRVFGWYGTTGWHRPIAALLEHSDDNSVWTTVENFTALAASSQPGDRGWFVEWNVSGAHRYWRVSLTHGGAGLMISGFEMVSTSTISTGRGYTVSPAPSATYPDFGVDVIRSGDADWAASVSGLLTFRNWVKSLENTFGVDYMGWVSSAVPIIRIDLGSAQAGLRLYAKGYWGTDSIDRPDGFSVEYSDNDSTWTTVQALTGLAASSQPGARQWLYSCDIAAAGSHRYWRLTVDPGGDATWISTVDIVASEIDQALGRAYTLSNAASVTFPDNVALDAILPGDTDWGRIGGKLTSGDLGHMGTAATHVGWDTLADNDERNARIDFGVAVSGSRLALWGECGIGVDTSSPKAIHLEHSDDDAAWTSVFAKTALTVATPSNERFLAVADISGSGGHRYWRARMVHGGTGSDTFMAISGIQLWDGVPSSPSGVSALATGSTTITVSWTDVSGETGYRVERSPNGTTGWIDVSGVLATDSTSFGDAGLAASTIYHYRVFAANALGNSDSSAVVNSTTTGGASGEAVLRPPRLPRRGALGR